MAAPKIPEPNEIIRIITDLLGTPIMCKHQGCADAELSKMKTPNDDANKGYHRTSSTERETMIIKEIRLIFLDHLFDDSRRVQARDVLYAIGSYYATLCEGVFLPHAEFNQLVSIVEKWRLQHGTPGSVEPKRH